MKRLILVASMFVATVAGAQDFQIGAKAGINISNFTGGSFDSVRKEALVGYHFGGFVRFRFDKLICATPFLKSGSILLASKSPTLLTPALYRAPIPNPERK